MDLNRVLRDYLIQIKQTDNTTKLLLTRSTPIPSRSLEHHLLSIYYEVRQPTKQWVGVYNKLTFSVYCIKLISKSINY